MTRVLTESGLHNDHKSAEFEIAVEPEPTSGSISSGTNQRHLKFDPEDSHVHLFSSVMSETSHATAMGDIVIPTPPGSECCEMRQPGHCAPTDPIQLETLRIKRVQEEQKLTQDELKLVQERQKLVLVEQELVRLQIEAREADVHVLSESSQPEASRPDAVDPQTPPVTAPKEDVETLDLPAESVPEDGGRIADGVSPELQHDDGLTASLPGSADVPPPTLRLSEQIAIQGVVIPTETAIERLDLDSALQSSVRILKALDGIHASTSLCGRALELVAVKIMAKVCAGPDLAQEIAELCKVLSNGIGPTYTASGIVDAKGNPLYGGALFRRYLLNRCQEKFETLPSCWDYAAARAHDLGIMRFIGELYNQGLLTIRIIDICVLKFLSSGGTPEPAAVELLATLLEVVRPTMEASQQGRTLINQYFEKMCRIMGMDGLPLKTHSILQELTAYH